MECVDRFKFSWIKLVELNVVRNLICVVVCVMWSLMFDQVFQGVRNSGYRECLMCFIFGYFCIFFDKDYCNNYCYIVGI